MIDNYYYIVGARGYRTKEVACDKLYIEKAFVEIQLEMNI